MIDKNGKLFGKINIIDLLLILVVAVGVILLGIRFLFNGFGEKQDTVRITFYGNWVNDFLPDAIKIGDPVNQYTTEIDLGTLTSFSSEPAYEYVFDAISGEIVEKPAINYCFLTFTVEAKGDLDEWGFTVEDTTFVVGGNYYINIGQTRTGCQIKSFELIDGTL